MTHGGTGDPVIRPWAYGDDEGLNELWGDAESPDAERGRLMLAPSVAQDGGAWRHCVVAEVSGVPVAAAVAVRGEIHPGRLWCYVEVAREERRRGLGRVLLGALREAVASSPWAGTRLRARVATGGSGDGFARATGFHTLQRSRLVRVLPAARGHEVLRDVWGRAGQPAGTELTREASGGVAVTHAFWDWYRAVHSWDPPADLPVGRVNRYFLADAHEVLTWRRGQDIAAFAVVYGALPAGQPSPEDPDGETPDEAGRPDLEVLVGQSPDDPSVRAVRLLLGQVLALHRGPVVVEVDESATGPWQVTEVLLGSGLAELVGETLVVGD